MWCQPGWHLTETESTRLTDELAGEGPFASVQQPMQTSESSTARRRSHATKPGMRGALIARKNCHRSNSSPPMIAGRATA